MSYQSSNRLAPNATNHPPASTPTNNSHTAYNDDSNTDNDMAAPLISKHSPTPSIATTVTSTAGLSSSSPSTTDASASSPSSDLLSSWEMLKLCIPVIPSQLGWAVGEALLIPYLMSLGLEETTANAIWLVNPLVGFFVQPYIGAWSDRYKGPWGRRRPFLFAFHFGIVVGLLMIGFAPELHQLLFPTVQPFDDEAKASGTLLLLIFTGCVLMELSNDLLTIPSRALLNDNLPEEQIDQGNAWFSAMNSLGAVIGLTMCFLPLQEVWPLSVLGTQLRATFVMCIGFIMTSNLFTMTIDEWIEEEMEAEEEEEDEDGDGEGEGEEEEEAAGETAGLLHKGLTTPGSGGSASRKMHTVPEVEHEHEQHDNHTEIVIDMPIPKAAAAAGEADEAEAEAEDEAAEEEEEEAEDELGHMSLLSSLLAFRLLPPALIAIWVTQFTWWLVIMQCSFWWTTWVGISVYGGDPLTSPDVFYEGVTYGIIGTLVHSIVSFFSSHLLTKANNTFGVTRVYHASAVIYSIATAALWWWRSKEASMVYMIGTGFFYPVINTNPFILIEVYTGYDEGGEEEGEAEAEAEEEEGEAEADKAASDEQSASKAAAGMNHSSFSIDMTHSPSDLLPAGGSVDIGRLSLDQRQTSDLPYESHTETETDSGSSSSSSSSSDSEPDTPLTGATDSVSESEGNMSEEELAARGLRSSAPRALNLSQYGYDMSTSLNEAYPYSDGEVVQGGGHMRPHVADDRLVESPSLTAYGSSLPLSSLLPLALESAAHPQPSSPHSPHSPDSPLTPLVSPGMVATVAAQHAQNAAMFPSAVSRSQPSEPPAMGLDSTQATPDRQQQRAMNRSGSASFSQLSPSTMQASSGQNNLTRRRPHPALAIGRPESGSDTEEKSQSQHSRAQQSTNLVPAASSPPSSALSIRSLLQQSGLPGTANREEKHSPPTHPSLTSTSSPNSPPSAPLTTSSTNKTAASHFEGEDEGEAEEELEEAEEEAEEAEAEYLKASTHRGVLTAIMNLSMGLSQIISATLGGVLISWWGDITIVFVISGVLCVVVNIVVVTYGLSSVHKAAAAEEEAEEEVELPTVRSEEDVERRMQQQEMERKRKQEKREEEERRRQEVEAQRLKDRDRILRRFMRHKDAAEHEHKTYGSVGSATGVVEPPPTERRHRRHRHHHKTDDSGLTSASLPTNTSLVPGSAAAGAAGSSHRRHHRRSHRHRDREGSVVELDRQHAQAYLMHALAAMSRMHSAHGQPIAAAPRHRAARPGTAAGKRSKAEEHEHTPLLTASSVLSPPPLVHAATTGSMAASQTPPTAAQASSALTSAASSASSAAGAQHGPLTSLLTHPSHQRLLYEITVLLHYYHVHHISLLPLHVQDRILARLAKHIRRHRRSYHHRIDADITSRRGLSGRYAMGEEVRMERERLHLINKRRRRRIRRKEREMRDRLQRSADGAALSATP